MFGQFKQKKSNYLELRHFKGWLKGTNSPTCHTKCKSIKLLNELLQV